MENLINNLASSSTVIIKGANCAASKVTTVLVKADNIMPMVNFCGMKLPVELAQGLEAKTFESSLLKTKVIIIIWQLVFD